MHIPRHHPLVVGTPEPAKKVVRPIALNFEDEVVRFHTRFLSDELMEKNFLKIVEPYDVVEIAYVAKKMELPESDVGAGERDEA